MIQKIFLQLGKCLGFKRTVFWPSLPMGKYYKVCPSFGNGIRKKQLLDCVYGYILKTLKKFKKLISVVI